MSTTVADLKGWFESGVRQGATHLVVVCDTFDHDDYPVYVKHGEDVHRVYAKFNGPNMQRVMEVYALHKGFDDQETIPGIAGQKLAHDFSQPFKNKQYEYRTREFACEADAEDFTLNLKKDKWVRIFADVAGGAVFVVYRREQ